MPEAKHRLEDAQAIDPDILLRHLRSLLKLRDVVFDQFERSDASVDWWADHEYLQEPYPELAWALREYGVLDLSLGDLPEPS